MKSAVLIGILLTVAMTSMASAQSTRKCPHGGHYCPPGTCAKFDHGPIACNLKNCSAANCVH